MNKSKQRLFEMMNKVGGMPLNENAMGRDILEILEGYLESAIWTEEESLNIENISTNMFSNESRDKAENDIKKFISIVGENTMSEIRLKLDKSSIGFNIWLTRNGHGSGFWDRDLGECGEIATKAAKELGEVVLEVGDDGYLYFL